jgi:hypothetical protein
VWDRSTAAVYLGQLGRNNLNRNIQGENMKTLLLTSILLMSFSVMANNPTKPSSLSCTSVGNYFSRVDLTLAPEHYDPTSSYNEAVRASVLYNYSNASNMTCTGHISAGVYDINCVGYYHGKEITEVKFRNVDDKIIASWNTSKNYGSIKIESVCTEYFKK